MVWAKDLFCNYLRGKQFTVYTGHKPFETQSKCKEKTINKLTEAFLKFDFVIKYKKRSEMPADFWSRNAIDAVGIFSNKWKLDQEQDEFCQCLKKHMHTHKKIQQIKTVLVKFQMVRKEA
jgi:hypothetical protein